MCNTTNRAENINLETDSSTLAAEGNAPGNGHSVTFQIPNFSELVNLGRSPNGVLAIIVAVFAMVLLAKRNELSAESVTWILALTLLTILLMFVVLITQNPAAKSIRNTVSGKRKILEDHLPELLKKSEDDLRSFFDTGRQIAPVFGAAPDDTLKALCHHIKDLVSAPALEIERFFQLGKRNIEIDRFAYQLVGDWKIATNIYIGDNKEVFKRTGGCCHIRKGDHRLRISGIWVNENGEKAGDWQAIHVILDKDEVFQFEFRVPVDLHRSHLGKIAFSNIVRDENDNPITMSGTWGLIGGDFNGTTTFTRMPLAPEHELGEIKQHRSKSQEKNGDIMTLKDEVRAFRIVLNILRGENLNVNRVFYQDTPDFFQVMIDDNVGTDLCRFYFNGIENRLSIPGEHGNTLYTIPELAELEKYRDPLVNRAIRLFNA